MSYFKNSSKLVCYVLLKQKNEVYLPLVLLLDDNMDNLKNKLKPFLIWGPFLYNSVKII